jgi:hypothetical protein
MEEPSDIGNPVIVIQVLQSPRPKITLKITVKKKMIEKVSS